MKFKNKEIVSFNNGVLWGVGRICGIAQTPLPVVGALYIMEVVSSNIPLPTQGYEYTHIGIHECHLKEVKE